MSTVFRKFWTMGAAGLLVLAACSPAAQPAAAPAPAAKAAPAPAAKAAPAPAAKPAAAAPAKPKAEPKVVSAKPKRGGTWRVGGEQMAPPPALDSARRSTATNLNLHSATSCKLVTWDERPNRIPGNHETVLPDMAERWETSADGTVWTFHLRKGVKLPPPVNTEITAKVVERAFLRIHAILPKASLNRQIPSLFTNPDTGEFTPKKPNLEIIDDYTIRMTLSEPDADFLSMLGSHYTVLMFDQFYEPTEDGWGEVKKAENFRGCGAFMMSEYVPGSHMSFIPNPNYYDPELPYVDVLENRFMFEPSVAAAALRAGQLDSWGLMVTLPLSLSKELESVPDLDITYIKGAWYWPWYWDVQNPPFDDVRVRRAVALALDRESWIKELYFGHGDNVVLMQPFVEFWNLPPEKMGEDGKYYTTYDPEAAKKLLAEAGYPNGFEFDIITSNAAAHVVSHPMIELSKAYFDAIGLTMNINIIDYGAWLRGYTPKGGIKQSGLARPALSSFVYSLIHPKLSNTTRGPGGSCLFCGLVDKDPEYAKAVALIEDQRRTLDVQQRLKKVHDLQRAWAQNMWTFYFPVPNSTLVNTKNVRDYNPIAGWNAGSWKYVWMEQ